MVPGEYVLATDPVTCNAGREAIELEVVNRGDRPVQVGSHFHFAEINPAVDFDREQALGRRLDIPAGTAVRFEPGDKKTVQLILLAGKRQVYGFHNMINGPLDPTEPAPIHHMESPDYGFETTATDDEATEKES